MPELPAALLLRAASFAAEKHRSQRRKDIDKNPYINHPLEVAALLANQGGVDDVELLVAALLHDTVEDTSATFDEIEQQFGAAIRQLVGEVTDDKNLKKQRRKELQIEHAPGISLRGKQLKLADKICNIRGMDDRSPAGWPVSRKAEYLTWAVAVVAGCRGSNAALEKLFDETIINIRKQLKVE